ncbi:MAG: T9SS type A sorting domain-containing protein, partial [Bacteroidota bacterium]
VQVASDSTFGAGVIVNDSTVADTFKTVSGLAGQVTYYWRVRARNAGGTGSFSSSFNFRTGSPAAPTLVLPANLTTNVSLTPTHVWNRTPGALTYRMQLSTSVDFTTIVLDTSGMTDTSRTVGPLQLNTIYFWRVNGANAQGTGLWSAVWRYRTILTSVEQTSGLPTEYALHQNYPNPFNPLTTISFSLPEQEKVTLRIYDVLGREVRTLVDETLPRGEYQTQFDVRQTDSGQAGELSSGVYFYRLTAGGYVATKKMSVVK